MCAGQTLCDAIFFLASLCVGGCTISVQHIYNARIHHTSLDMLHTDHCVVWLRLSTITPPRPPRAPLWTRRGSATAYWATCWAAGRAHSAPRARRGSPHPSPIARSPWRGFARRPAHGEKNGRHGLSRAADIHIYPAPRDALPLGYKTGQHEGLLQRWGGMWQVPSARTLHVLLEAGARFG